MGTEEGSSVGQSDDYVGRELEIIVAPAVARGAQEVGTRSPTQGGDIDSVLWF